MSTLFSRKSPFLLLYFLSHFSSSRGSACTVTALDSQHTHAHTQVRINHTAVSHQMMCMISTRHQRRRSCIQCSVQLFIYVSLEAAFSKLKELCTSTFDLDWRSTGKPERAAARAVNCSSAVLFHRTRSHLISAGLDAGLRR